MELLLLARSDWVDRLDETKSLGRRLLLNEPAKSEGMGAFPSPSKPTSSILIRKQHSRG